MAGRGETVSRNDGVVVVYRSCRQSSASSRSLPAAPCSDNVGMQLGPQLVLRLVIQAY
jgi:hypothetical protein